MRLHLDKPWIDLTPEAVRRLPGQLGVYQVADGEGRVLRIGYAGARELFGLRSALDRELGTAPAGAKFRYEVNTQYQSRWAELLMLHQRDHGGLPPGNERDAPAHLGRMR